MIRQLFLGALLLATVALAQDDFADIFNITLPEQNETDRFDWDVFKQVANGNPNNLILSPVSLKIALEVLYQGSGGNSTTQREIHDVFRLDIPQSRAKSQIILKSLLEPSKDYVLDLGTRMYLDKSINPNQRFRTTIHNYLKCDIRQLDVNNPSESIQEANAWVRNITHDQIKELVNHGDMENVVVLLLNAMYFKGSWKRQFDGNETALGPFYMTNSRSVHVPLMKQIDRFMYHRSKSLDASIIRLPYLGDKFSMYVLLPENINGLQKLIRDVDPPSLKRMMTLMEDTNVKLTMPKFKFEHMAKMVPALQQLGIRELFTNSASLPMIARGASLTKRLKVSNIIQKSGIEVNEIGTVAYAATEISLVNKFGEDDHLEDFKINKPFMFFIDDATTNQILFIGKVEDPTDAVQPVLPLQVVQPPALQGGTPSERRAQRVWKL